MTRGDLERVPGRDANAFRRRLAREARRRRLFGPGGPIRSAALGLALALAAALLHRPAHMLTTPYWLDETWVALSLRAPLHALPEVTGSTPVGWTFLLRLVPPGVGAYGARLVPLLFTAALCPLAYALGRELAPERRLPRWVLAVAAAVLPAAMRRHDLKQYTADAFVAVLLVLLAARAERLGSRRSVAALATAASSGLLVSHTAALTGAAVFAALLVAHASCRAWRRALEAAAGAAAFLGAVGLDYAAFVRRAATPGLVAYWEGYYVPRRAAAAFLGRRAASGALDLGLGPWGLVLALLAAACAVLWWRGRRAVAVAVPVLLAGCIVAARVQVYPLWETRTSLFLYAVLTLAVAYAAASLPRLPRVPRVVAAVPALALLATLGTVARGADSDLFGDAAPAVTRTIVERRAPGDLVVVDVRRAYGFALAWPERPAFRRYDGNAVGYLPYYPASSGVVVADDVATMEGPRSLPRLLAESRSGTVWLFLSRRSRQAHYLKVARDNGVVEVVRDDPDFLLLRVTRRT